MVCDVYIIWAEVASGENTAKHHWMEGFHPSAQHFSRLRHRFDGGDGGPKRFNRALRASGREDFDAVCMQAVDDGGKSFFVKDGNQGTADGAFHGVEAGLRKRRN